MLPYLHILIRVEDDGSLHALGAFTSKEKQLAYQAECGLEDSQVRLDFYNGPFDEDIKVIFAGHRRWNMDLFQLGGYFQSEGEAWTWVTQDGYVSVLRIDTTYEEEKFFEKEALERYSKLQRLWRLSTYEELKSREGSFKAQANIKLRFYIDALQSFKPGTTRDLRALYAMVALIVCLPIAIFYYTSQGPEFGVDVDSVSWLPKFTSDISYYRSKQVQVFEFSATTEEFRRWADSRDMDVRRLNNQEIVSRYKAYLPISGGPTSSPSVPNGVFTKEQLRNWHDDISAKVRLGLIAQGSDNEIALYDPVKQRAYYESLKNF